MKLHDLGDSALLPGKPVMAFSARRLIENDRTRIIKICSLFCRVGAWHDMSLCSAWRTDADYEYK